MKVLPAALTGTADCTESDAVGATSRVAAKGN